jgi:hypothetical protein
MKLRLYERQHRRTRTRCDLLWLAGILNGAREATICPQHGNCSVANHYFTDIDSHRHRSDGKQNKYMGLAARTTYKPIGRRSR